LVGFNVSESTQTNAQRPARLSTVSRLLDKIEKLANDDAGNPALADALDSLSAHLLEHLIRK
jgi:hypothetical protein